MRLVILGPPGAGKGTQSKLISQNFGIPAISTGDIFRSNIANGTELGVLVDGLVKSGKYVPDEVTNDLVRNRLQENDCLPGFLLDGYPRTAAQVDELDTMLAEHGSELDVVLELTVDQDEVIDRLIKRSHIEGREDDSQEVVRHRLDVYTEQTAPLVEVYSKRGLLVQVDGLGEIVDVFSRVSKALEAPARNHAARPTA
jgi:adenylate kinase